VLAELHIARLLTAGIFDGSEIVVSPEWLNQHGGLPAFANQPEINQARSSARCCLTGKNPPAPKPGRTLPHHLQPFLDFRPGRRAIEREGLSMPEVTLDFLVQQLDRAFTESKALREEMALAALTSGLEGRLKEVLQKMRESRQDLEGVEP
jgi:hypothetical protein